MDFSLHENCCVDYIKNLGYKDLIIFLIPFIIFMYYLYVFNPGILTIDSYGQLHQIAQGRFDNWHPFFHTFIEMICLKIYPDTKSICILQIFTFSMIWMVICHYHRNDSDKLFIIQVIITLIISLIPLNAVFSITLWKDILYSYFLLFLCFLIEVMIDRDYNISYLFAVVFSLTMAFICQLRPNGLIVIISLLIIFAFYLFKKNKTKKLYIVIPALTILFILMISSLNVAYEVNDVQKDVIFDKTTHILSYYDLNVNMSHDDKQKIHEMISEKDIKKNFNIYLTDHIYAASNESVFDADKGLYIKLVIKYSLKNPLKFLEYIFESSNMVFDITRDSDWIGYEYPIDLEANKNAYYNRYKIEPLTTYDNASSKNIGTPAYDFLYSIAETFKNNIILDTIFNSPALYWYLALLVLGLMYVITKSKEILLVYLPCFLNILTIILSTPFQGTRYLYSNFLVFYLLIIILVKLLYDKIESKDDLNQFS